jgi:hypothetical protein
LHATLRSVIAPALSSLRCELAHLCWDCSLLLSHGVAILVITSAITVFVFKLPRWSLIMTPRLGSGGATNVSLWSASCRWKGASISQGCTYRKKCKLFTVWAICSESCTISLEDEGWLLCSESSQQPYSVGTISILILCMERQVLRG